MRVIAPVPAAIAAVLSLPAMAQDSVTVRLDWTPNTNHIGFHVAEAKGFYADAGLDLQLLPFDAQGADFEVRSVLSLFTLRASGEDVVGVLAVAQRETGRVVYRGDRDDIARPSDLSDLVYGGFGTLWEDALVQTIIAHDGGEPDYDKVVLSMSVYDALDAGEVDFTLDIYTWEGVQKELEGEDYGAFAYADYGVPDQHTTVLIATGETLAADPERARAFVSATRRGYEYALANPEEAADILIAAAPELEAEAELVRASLDAIISGDFFATPEGAVGVFDAEKMEALGDFLFEAEALVDGEGVPLAERPQTSAYFTNDYLD